MATRRYLTQTLQKAALLHFVPERFLNKSENCTKHKPVVSSVNGIQDVILLTIWTVIADPHQMSPLKHVLSNQTVSVLYY
jgi:hypothetical protein